jgi:hypothetical protein
MRLVENRREDITPWSFAQPIDQQEADEAVAAIREGRFYILFPSAGKAASSPRPASMSCRSRRARSTRWFLRAVCSANGYRIADFSKNEEPKVRLRATRRLEEEESVDGDEAEAGGEPQGGDV